MSLGTEKKKKKKAIPADRYGPTNSVKNIEWWILGDDAKQVWKIEWWVMEIEWSKKWSQTAPKNPISTFTHFASQVEKSLVN